MNVAVRDHGPAGPDGATLPSRFGPVPDHPVLDRVGEVVRSTIAPVAPATDARGVPRDHLTALTGTGLFGLNLPGGTRVPAAVAAEAQELIAGACPSTHLITSQHATPAQWIGRSGQPALHDLLPDLVAGRRIGGAAFGHVRTWPGRTTVRVRREPGGWRFDGVAPWFSGHGLVDLVLLAGVDERDQAIVFAVVDLPQPATVRAVPLRLAAIDGARTVALELDGLTVPDERVAQVVGVDEWKARDGLDGPPVYPGSMGLARAAAGYALDRFPDNPDLRHLADEIALLRTLASGPGNAAEAREPGHDVFYWRSRSVNLAVRAANAAVVARGGAGLLADDPVQVWARAALFLQVRGLSPRLREAHLARLAGLP
ncbi:acyl-CoA dehydrogenase family protein [Polymorphospora rubra]|uniref:acyl-CoA dehydrogenase family protein n=1 Tax=Polymorphospora rubra TaxID=338584 RepID=UPI0031CE6687